MSNLSSEERVVDVRPYSLRLRIEGGASLMGITMDGSRGEVLVELSSPLEVPASPVPRNGNGSTKVMGTVRPLELGSPAPSSERGGVDNGVVTPSSQKQPESGSRRVSRPYETHFVALGLIGLSGVFLANAATAFAEPAGFISMVRTSVFGTLLTYVDSQVIGLSIGLNDVCLGVAMLIASVVRRLRGVVFAWTGMWLLLVTVIKVSALGLG